MRASSATSGRVLPPHPHRRTRPGLRGSSQFVAWLFLAAVLPGLPLRVHAQDPATTATVFVHGFARDGADQTGTFGWDRAEALLDSVARLTGMPVADGGAVLPPHVAGATDYYGDTPPPYYTPADVAELAQVTAQWGGGVPRYALIVAKYARNLMQRSGARHVNFVSASFGSLIVRWIVENDVEGLASAGAIARWHSIEGLLAGNWAASRNRLVDLVGRVSPFPVDVDHMHHDWVEAQFAGARVDADHPLYARILLGSVVSSDDRYGNSALSTLLHNAGQWQPNDGVQLVADASFRNVSAVSRLAGLPPTLSYSRSDHFSIQDSRGAWAELATFLTQRRRVTVTMTSARVMDLKEPQDWYWDWRPAEVVLESRVHSPAVLARWGIADPISTREKDGAVAPLRRYWSDGETQNFAHVLFDDLVLDEETTLRLSLRAEEVDLDHRYGVHETLQTPYYDDLGAGTLDVSAIQPGTYPFQAQHWSCTITVAVFAYGFGPPLEAPVLVPLARRTALLASPNPHGASLRLTLAGLEPASAAQPATLEVMDLSGRRVRTLHGDAAGGFAWDGRDESGSRLPAGIYLHRVTTAHGSWTTRAVLLN